MDSYNTNKQQCQGPGIPLGIDASGFCWAVLLITTGAQISTSFISQGISALVPFLKVEFELNNMQIGFVGSSVYVGMVFTALLSGRAADIWGEKLVLVVGGILVGAAMMLTSLANSFATLLFFLVFTGLWAATTTPAGSKAIMDWFPAAKRGFAMGVRQTGVPIGGLLGALVLPSLALKYGLPITMIIMGLAAFLGAFVCLVTYHNHPHSGNAKTEKATSIKVFKEIFRNRNIWLACFTANTYVAAQFCLTTYLIIFVMSKVGFSIEKAAFLLALAQFAGAAGRIFWGIFSDKVFKGARRPVMTCIGIIAAAMSLILTYVTPNTESWLLVILVWFFGFSAIGWNGIFITFLSELVEKEQVGTVVGMGVTVMQIGVFAFPPLFGLLVDKSGSFEISWRFLTLLLACGVLALSLVREQKVPAA